MFFEYFNLNGLFVFKEYYQSRINEVKQQGDKLYPHKFHVTHSFDEIIKTYSNISNGQASNDKVNIAGRVYSKRTMGKGLKFFDIHSNNQRIQVMATAK